MATNSAHASSFPRSVDELSRIATTFDYNDAIPLHVWLRSADTIQKEARIYEAEGNDQQTYILLLRHAILVLERLSRHPDSRLPHNKPLLNEANKAVQNNLEKLEALKPRIQTCHAISLQKWRNPRTRNVVQRQDAHGVPHNADRTPSDNLISEKEALEPGENRDLAARIAQRELLKRNGNWRPGAKAGDESLQHAESDLGEVLTHRERRYDEDLEENSLEDLSQCLKDMDRWQRRISSPQGNPRRNEAVSTTAYNYPVVKRASAEPARVNGTHSSHASAKIPTSSYPLPSLPPKVPAEGFREISKPPPVPSKFSIEQTVAQTAQDITQNSDDKLDPKNYWFKPSAELENGNALRSVFLPRNLRTKFLEVSLPNTLNNLETCGVLCGTLMSNALFITKLVIPEQESTSDTCETLNEGALFNYCDKEDLMVLGWIHTHPTQSCFMSSRDLHTHCGYQVMLPESIAIVCAPSKDPSWGVFRLTDPPGMQIILKCTQSSVFHPHPGNDLYTGALRPGHVYETPMGFELVDLRP